MSVWQFLFWVCQCQEIFCFLNFVSCSCVSCKKRIGHSGFVIYFCFPIISTFWYSLSDMRVFVKMEKIEYRTFIKYLPVKGNIPTQIKDESAVGYGDCTIISHREILSSQHFGRRRTFGTSKNAITEDNIAQFHQMVLNMRQSWRHTYMTENGRICTTNWAVSQLSGYHDDNTWITIWINILFPIWLFGKNEVECYLDMTKK